MTRIEVKKQKREEKKTEHGRQKEEENSQHAIPKFTPPEITNDPMPWKPSTYAACPSVTCVVGALRPPVPTRRLLIQDVSDGFFDAGAGLGAEGRCDSSSGGSSEAPICVESEVVGLGDLLVGSWAGSAVRLQRQSRRIRSRSR